MSDPAVSPEPPVRESSLARSRSARHRWEYGQGKRILGKGRQECETGRQRRWGGEEEEEQEQEEQEQEEQGGRRRVPRPVGTWKPRAAPPGPSTPGWSA